MATTKQKTVFNKILENPGISLGKAMLEAGYEPNTAHNPTDLTESKGWKELMEEHLPTTLLAKKHVELLQSKKIEHMVFMLGPKNEADKQQYIEEAIAKAKVDGKEYKEIEYVTDVDIIEMLAEVNCKVKRIIHRETARDVYFWTQDSKALKDALDMAYKLHGSYAPDKHVSLNLNGEIIANEELETLAHQLNAVARSNTRTSIASNGTDPHIVDAEAQDQKLPGPTDGVHEPQIHVGPDQRHEPAPSMAEATADRSE